VQRLLALVNNSNVGKDIDALFVGSQTPTKSETETAVEQYWSTWGSSVIAVIHSASVLIVLVMMLVLGNGMAMATRESTREYAAMRAIGYRSRVITSLVLVEGALVAVLGCAAGLAVAPSVLTAFAKLLEDRLGGSYELELNPLVTAIAVAVALLACMGASAWPAWRSGHLRIVDALRRVA
jgi:putative ABC transport system permease protein